MAATAIRLEGRKITGLESVTSEVPCDVRGIAHVGGACVAALSADGNSVVVWSPSLSAWVTVPLPSDATGNAAAATTLAAFPGVFRLIAFSPAAAGAQHAARVFLIDPVQPSVEAFTIPAVGQHAAVAGVIPIAIAAVAVVLETGVVAKWCATHPSILDFDFAPRVRVRLAWSNPSRGVAGGLSGVGTVDGTPDLVSFALTSAGGLVKSSPWCSGPLPVDPIPFVGVAVDAEVITNGLRDVSLTCSDTTPTIAPSCAANAGAAPDSCPVCFDDIVVGDGTALALDCGHAGHIDCLEGCTSRAEKYLAVGHRIAFTMARCVHGCGRLFRHPSFEPSQRLQQRYDDIISDIAQRVAVDYPGQRPDEVIDGYLYYVCHHCAKPYWGGSKDCAAMMSGEKDVDPAALCCPSCVVAVAGGIPGCSSVPCPTLRPAPGFDATVYLCDYCCSPATQLSLGRIRGCDDCVAAKRTQPLFGAAEGCVGATSCPFGGNHPAKRGRPIGCWACMSAGDPSATTFDGRLVRQPPASADASAAS